MEKDKGDAMYNVLIVEDDPMTRQLLEMFIHQSNKYSLAAAIDDAEFAPLYCAKNDVDLVLMDIRTAMRANGLDAAKRIKKKHPKIKIIICTSMPEYSYLERAKKIGVDSFWYKTVVEESFFDLIDRTMAGEKIFPDSTPELQLGNASSSEFTDRELEVLRELMTGDSNNEIAERLNISISTLKTHLQHLQDKTGFRNRTELAMKAREIGLVINDND